MRLQTRVHFRGGKILTPDPRFRIASTAPGPTAGDDLARWDNLGKDNLARAQKAADTWRNGMAGFVTLVLSALVLKGNDLAAITGWQRGATMACWILGITFALTGLWRALLAQVPTEKLAGYRDVVRNYGSIADYEIAVAARGHRRIAQAQRLVMAALISLVTGIAIFWTSPPQPFANTDSLVKIVWMHGTREQEACGRLLPTSPGRAVLQANIQTDPEVLLLGEITKITTVETCDQ